MKHFRNFLLLLVVVAIGLIVYLGQPDMARQPIEKVEGTKPVLTEVREQFVPTVKVASVDRWKVGEKPTVAAGLKVELFAGDLDHPRNLYTLPNGDILVAETNSPPPGGFSITRLVEKWLMSQAGAGVPSANRITLLRDSDGDGKIDLRSVFLTGLNSPFGMAVVGDTLYVANTDAVVSFPYKAGETKITAEPKKIYDLNALFPNMHWTRNLAAAPDGKHLYVSVGSNSNIGEGGLDKEKGRARVIEIDLATGKGIAYAVGLRNPVGMDWDDQGRLWTVVNERDMLGSDMVPDYLARVEFASDYGWPWHYYGGFTDHRVRPENEEKREYERRPDYALGPHVAALGLAFSSKAKLGDSFASGAFIARHGSWNRKPISGYDVVFVKFAHSEPTGALQNVLSGFISKDGKAKGRPTMLAIDKSGALLVSDDVGNRIWRVTAG